MHQFCISLDSGDLPLPGGMLSAAWIMVQLSDSDSDDDDDDAIVVISWPQPVYIICCFDYSESYCRDESQSFLDCQRDCGIRGDIH